jgi:hypothetical protein
VPFRRNYASLDGKTVTIQIIPTKWHCLTGIKVANIFCARFQTEKSGETPEKEQIELEEKDDSTTEKDKKKKEKKEKKKKEPKEKKPKGPCKIDVMTEHLNLTARDANNINHEIDVSGANFN